MLRMSNNWNEFKCLDAGNGEKLENWNGIILRRPDPQAIWTVDKDIDIWKKIDGQYFRSNKGGGEWKFFLSFPE